MPSIEERRKKNEERLAALRQEKQQAVNRLNDKFNKQMAPIKKANRDIVRAEKTAQRNARTHRLIQNGALAEQYLRCENLPSDLFKEYLDALVNHQHFKQAQRELVPRHQSLLSQRGHEKKSEPTPSGVEEADIKGGDVTHHQS